MNKKARQARVRNKLRLVSNRPRLCVTKSNRFFYLQLIDDKLQRTVIGLHEKKFSGQTRSERVASLGKEFAKLLKTAKQTNICLDRGSNRYHGLLQQLVDELRNGGINI